MGKKNCNQCDDKKNNNGEEKKKINKDNNGGKQDDNNIRMIVVVLKIELHCDGCASKVAKCIRSLEGVDSVKGVAGDLNKLTVIGNVDPLKLRETIEQKTKKKVEIISPVMKKENSNKENQKDGDGNEKKKNSGDKPAKQSDEKKPKEPPVTTTVLKVRLHCEGCIQKIQRLVSKTKGYMEMSIDRQKELVTVKGAIDVKALTEALKAKIKKPVEIVPAKKEGNGEKKEKDVKGEKNLKNEGGGGGAGKAAGGGGGEGGVMDVMVEGNRMVQNVPQFEYGYPYVYGPGYMVDQVHAPQIFSDENPNACVVM